LLVTDHQLKYIFNPTKNISAFCAVRLQRWAIILSSYQYEGIKEGIKYQDIGSVDGLSRLPIKGNIGEENLNICCVSEECPLDYIKIGEETGNDQILSLVIKFLREGQTR